MIGKVISMHDNEASVSSNLSGHDVIGSLPFVGRWLVGSTPAKRVPSHGTDMFGVGYAIDFIAVDEQNRSSTSTSWRTHLGTESPEIFYAFGLPVVSPVSGKVVSIHNGEPDHEARRSVLTLIPYMLGQGKRIRKGPETIAGNYVIIAPDNSDVFIAIVHLQLNSLVVEKGQYISEGQHIANCGNSGNSTQPHIHIQAMNSTDFSITQGVPLYFRKFSQWNKGESVRKSRKNAFPDADTIVSPE
ncbi:M23 family metallopeptidase [Paraliobacillus zengyii]|uniref:M23 family metallopeptidase n=2 Tax=Bacillaceae TaxID=186817 RepID=UPI001F54108E|nr:M23 family metallopeptidase [Paraliobacillus zengyii]